MVVQEALSSVHSELLRYLPASNSNKPNEKWTISQSIMLLNSYSSGLTRSLLLAELEVLWRRQSRSGESTIAGNLQQILVNPGALRSDEILRGSIIALGELRHQLIEDSGHIDLIMHRQLSDFFGYIKYQELSLYGSRLSNNMIVDERKCLLTRCKFLRVHLKPVLLASEISKPSSPLSPPRLNAACSLPLAGPEHRA